MKDYRGFGSGNFLFQSSQGTNPPKPPEFISAQTPILLAMPLPAQFCRCSSATRGRVRCRVAFAAKLDREKSCRGNLTV
jgi:hypothetical protein